MLSIDLMEAVGSIVGQRDEGGEVGADRKEEERVVRRPGRTQAAQRESFHHPSH